MNRNVMKTLPKTAEELDRRFDAGEDLESLGFDLSKATRPGLETKRINIDLPTDFLEALDEEAARRGITRQSLIKVWLYERLHGDSVARQRAYEQALAVLFALATKQGGRGKKALETSGFSRSGLREAVIDIMEKEDRPLNVLDLAHELENELENLRKNPGVKKVRSEKSPAKGVR